MLQFKSYNKQRQEFLYSRKSRNRIAINDTVLRCNADGTESIGTVKSIVKNTSHLGVTEVTVEWGRFQWDEDCETSVIKRSQLTWRDIRQAWTFIE